MPDANKTFGFSRSDAEELVSILGSQERTYLEGRPRGGNTGRVIHFKAPGGGIAAFNTGTATMGSATCDIYSCSASGVLTDSGEDRTIWNAAAAVAASAWGVAAMNEAGLWVAIVEKC